MVNQGFDACLLRDEPPRESEGLGPFEHVHWDPGGLGSPTNVISEQGNRILQHGGNGAPKHTQWGAAVSLSGLIQSRPDVLFRGAADLPTSSGIEKTYRASAYQYVYYWLMKPFSMGRSPTDPHQGEYQKTGNRGQCAVAVQGAAPDPLAGVPVNNYAQGRMGPNGSEIRLKSSSSVDFSPTVNEIRSVLY